MALWVQNVTEGPRSDDEPHDYRVMLNDRELARFQHVWSQGAAECLRRAAEAIETTGRPD